MKVFDYDGLLTWDNEILELIIKIHEANTRCKLNFQHSLDRLVIAAHMKSTYASNAIEGIFTNESRYSKLIAGAMPKSEDEELIARYHKALQTIEDNFSNFPVEPSTIKYLHSILYPENNGEYKKADNVIVSIDCFGNQKVIFKPLSHEHTETAIKQICKEYNACKLPSLLLIPHFIHDFLCIHPFDDGNGRTSRLLTFLLLYMSGFHIVKYISLDSAVWKSVKGYYDALYHSGKGWHNSNKLPLAFTKYFLIQLLQTYEDFEQRMKLVEDAPQAVEAVRRAFNLQAWQYKYELAEFLPTIGIKSIEASLNKLVRDGYLTKAGSGNRTFYKKM